MNKITLLIVGIAVLVLAHSALKVSNFFQVEDTAITLQPDNLKLVARGKAIYQTRCASCHGNKLEGQPNWKSPGADGKLPAPPHDDSGHTWHHSDQLLFDLTKFGLKKFIGEKYQSNMPAYETVLSDQKIIAVLSFIKSTWPDKIKQRHDRINKAAKKRRKD